MVLIHGLWSNPWSWARMIKEMEADATLRARYQFWTFGYSTGDPLAYSATMLRRDLDEVRRTFDPERSDAAFNRMVVVGHSMGGLLARMMVQESGTRLWRLVSDRPVEDLAGDQADCDLLGSALIFRPRPEVRRVVFIATRHRGSRVDRGGLECLGPRLVRLSDPLRASYGRLIAREGPDFFVERLRKGLPTSIDELEWQSPMLMGLDELGLAPNVTAHSMPGVGHRLWTRGEPADPVKFSVFADDNFQGERQGYPALEARGAAMSIGFERLLDDHGRRPTLRRRSFPQLVVLLGAWAGLSGCIGPTAIRHTRLRYNEVIRDTNDQQLLLNIVRLRYADSPVFIDLPNITSQFDMAGRGNYLGGYGQGTPGRTSLGSGELSLRDTPTLSYHPREGREIARALLTPLSADLLIVVNAGSNLEQLLLFAMNDINDVPNAPGATVLIPEEADDNSLYIRGIRLLARLRARDATELAIGTTEEAEASSDPIPKRAVQGRDLHNALRDSYVYRTRSDDQMTLLKREKGLYLRIRDPYVHSPEMEEVERIFRLTPGLSRYRIKSELSEEANQRLPSPLGNDTIYVNPRSVLQIMTFLSKGVCVPEEHVRSGIAPVTPGPAGRPFDWTRVTAGNFVVHAQKHRPRAAEVAVPYRGYWFYIASDDVKSRAALAILEIVFGLQESDGKNVGPLLTLPVGG